MLRARLLGHWAPGVLRTQAFRIVLIYVFVFAVSATVLVGFTYWNTERALDAQTDQIIDAEILGLSEQYQRLGLRGLADVVVSRSLNGGSGLYLLADGVGRTLAGNLDEWPRRVAHDGEFIEFDYDRRVQGQLVSRRARGRAFALVGGFELLVARDVYERHLTKRLFTTTLPWSVGLMLLFGLVGGALMSRNVLRRLEQINRTSAEIVAGDFSRRVPVTGTDDEFDELAENLNHMLDRTERLMKGMREVADSVAHDLRTPLTRLRGMAELALSPNAEPAATREALADCVEESERVLAMLNTLMDITEAEAGMMKLQRVPVDLCQLVREVVELYQYVAEERKVTLHTELPAACEADMDRNRIRQVFANLLDNAIKYTPEGGRVTIAVRDEPDQAVAVFRDTGIGIPAEEQEKIWARLYRGDKSRSQRGLGLGLSLVKAVVEAHGGKVTVSSHANEGSEFTVKLPKKR